MVSPGWLGDVKAFALEHTSISPQMIHRRFRIDRKSGEALLRELERQGIVGPPVGDGSREVLGHD